MNIKLMRVASLFIVTFLIGCATNESKSPGDSGYDESHKEWMYR